MASPVGDLLYIIFILTTDTTTPETLILLIRLDLRKVQHSLYKYRGNFASFNLYCL